MSSKILTLKTGGTICQKKNEKGVYIPSTDEYLDLVPGLQELADITVRQLANLDSTNMSTHNRADIAHVIYDGYWDYDGFLVIGGTDTMVDTAAALNYMIRPIGKPIILTGSQIPAFEGGTDALNNLHYATLSAIQDIAEVALFFGSYLMRGNRAKKVDERGFQAFYSPRIEPLASTGISLELASHRLVRRSVEPVLFTDFVQGVETYTQTSGSSAQALEKMVEDQSVKGIVLEGFGAGNVQERLLPYLERSSELGKPVVVTTVCDKGAAEMDLYEVGSKAAAVGCISARDMTSECAAQKLMYALGRSRDLNPEDTLKRVRHIMHTDYALDISL